jgi:hypothetical protein
VLQKNNRLIKTFFHEISHYFFRSHFASPPKWINEGLAEYFEYLNVDTSSLQMGTQNHKLNRIRRWLKEDIQSRIERVLTVSNRQWSSENTRPDFPSSSTSYALVYFLMSTEEGKSVLQDIILRLQEGLSSVESIQSAYPGGYEVFIRDFINYYE